MIINFRDIEKLKTCLFSSNGSIQKTSIPLPQRKLDVNPL
jgi:hypothetical protein